jgi:replicative DNA helicase
MTKLSAPIFRLKRQARLLARDSKIPLHKALDTVARQEGYGTWSHLAASNVDHRRAKTLLAALTGGDLVLLGARPGHGKTLMGLELALEAARAGRQGFFFSLEENQDALLDRLRTLGADGTGIDASLIIDTSDDICADYIADRVRGGRGDSVVVIDYLQILDQKRINPELSAQLEALESLARNTPMIVIAIAQIDRAFELKSKRLPDLSDVRLPNPINLEIFTKTCFLHEGEVLLEGVN